MFEGSRGAACAPFERMLLPSKSCCIRMVMLPSNETEFRYPGMKLELAYSSVTGDPDTLKSNPFQNPADQEV
jgi:hypothetical protein